MAEKEAAAEARSFQAIAQAAKAIIHIGKQVPKRLIDLGYREVSAQHIGKGVWLIRCEKV